MGVDQCEYRAAMSRLPTGVTVLTTPSDAGHEVMTANAVTSVSLEPTLLLASVQSESRWLAAVTASGRFAVNVLAEHHEELARWCASRARHDRPEVLEQHQSLRTGEATGSLLIDDATVAIECRVHEQLPAGDHVLVIGEVVATHVQRAECAPLLFFNRAYSSVKDDGGHGRLHRVEPLPADADVYPAGPEVPAAAASG